MVAGYRTNQYDGRRRRRAARMKIPEDQVLANQVTDWITRAYSIGAVALGLGLIWWAPGAEHSALRDVSAALADVLVSIGTIGLIYEIALRRSVYREMMRLVGIQRSLVQGQVIAAGRYSEVRWSAILEDRSNYRALLFDPLSWVEHNFHMILSSGENRLVEAQIFMPDPAADCIDSIASSLDIEVEDFRSSLRQAVALIERQWAGKAKAQELRRGSSIEVRFVSIRPTYSICIADRFSVLTFTGSVGRAGADPDYAIVYAGDKDIFPSRWFHRQLAAQEQGNIAYYNEIEA